MELTATIVERSLWTIVHLEGELDLGSQAHIISVMDDAMDVGAGGIVLDFVDLEFVDTSGVSAILEGVERARTMNVDVVVANPSVLARRVLAVCGFRDVISARMPTASSPHPGVGAGAWDRDRVRGVDTDEAETVEAPDLR